MHDDLDENGLYASFWGHLNALRRTVLWIFSFIVIGMIACFVFYQPLISFLIQPWTQDNQAHSLVLLGPLEGVGIALKTSFWIGLLATSPLWLFFLIHFIRPALRTDEKRLLLPFIIVSFAFIAIGCCFAYFVTIPLANSYLKAFNQSLGENLWSLSAYLDYTFFLLLANGLAFELCAIGIFAVQLNLISAEMLIRWRRSAIVMAFIIGALLTPPDILTQILLAVPLICLYEGVILYARLNALRAKANHRATENNILT